MAEQRIYYHVGTGKTGTTYLQYRVFPKVEGLYYIQRTRYKKVIDIIKGSDHAKYLFSREYDQQLEKEVTAFAAHYPEAIPIIVFRRHDSYITSQYKRFVKNGFQGSFTDFFNLDDDSGYFKQSDLDYSRQLGILEERFQEKPLVFIYEDFRKAPQAFVQEMIDQMGATIDLGQVNFNRKHTSYNEQQLKAMQAMGKRMNLTKRRLFKNSFLNLFGRLYLGTIRYSTLYIGKLLPSRFFREGPLIAPEELERVAEAYAADWEHCRGVAVTIPGAE